MRVSNSLFQQYDLFLERRGISKNKVVGVALTAVGLLSIASFSNAELYSRTISQVSQCLAIRAGLATDYFGSTVFFSSLFNTILVPSGAINGVVTAAGLVGAVGIPKVGIRYGLYAGVGVVLGGMYDTLFSESPRVPLPRGEWFLVRMTMPPVAIASSLFFWGMISAYAVGGKCSAAAVEWIASKVTRSR